MPLSLPHRSPTSARATARSGFTLIELMITIVITALVISATYSLVGSSAEVFHQQEVGSENQNNLRFASEMLRQDIQRAGYHLSPNTASDSRVCPKPATALRAIDIIAKTLDPGDGSAQISFDELLLSGDFSGLPPLRVASISDPTTLQVDLSALLDALGPTATAADAAEVFSRSVRAQQLISVTNPDGFTQFALVASADPADLKIYLQTPLQRAQGTSSCGIMGVANQMHEVNIIHSVRYTLEADATDVGRVDLVRYDVNPSTSANVDNSRLLIANHVVSMRFLPIGVTNPASSRVALEGDADLLSLGAGSVSAVTSFSTTPQRTRFINYRIQTRTHRPVPRRLAVPDSIINSDGADFVYRPLGNGDVAEVRTQQGKVEIPNLILRDLK
jgi:prepilin-type N-terminal cleavage/methylation domain-containing protein